MSIQALKESMKAQKCVALILSEENILYFTGFSSTNGVLLVTGETALFYTDGRYIEAAQNQITSCDDVLLLKTMNESVVPFLQTIDCKSILLEDERLSYARVEKLKNDLPFPVQTGALDKIIRSIRKIKQNQQIDKIIRAQRIAEQALEVIKPCIAVGAVERELALELDYTMLRLGAQALSFETIFVSGANSSMPHGVPTDKKIERGDFVTIDFGAVIEGYHSDMTRTFAVGEVSDKQRDVYETVLRAQLAAIDAIRPGKRCSDMDQVARDVITQGGYGEFFNHSLGHGVGVEIHEPPYLSSKSEETLEIGNVITVEPGIYLPGAFGVRIEDMGVVTESGYNDFTKAPKTLEIL